LNERGNSNFLCASSRDEEKGILASLASMLHRITQRKRREEKRVRKELNEGKSAKDERTTGEERQNEEVTGCSGSPHVCEWEERVSVR
jgi:hypothetical protein